MADSNCNIISVQFKSSIVRTFIDEFGNTWFCAKDSCNILGYVNDRDAIAKHCRSEGVAKFKTPTEGGIQSMTYINELSLCSLISKSRTVTSKDKQDLIKFLQQNGFCMQVEFFSRKEIEFFNLLENVLNPFDLDGSKNYPCGKYHIDFYIPSLKVAVEYDENGHRNYNEEDEFNRQSFIEKELGCRFIRVSDSDSDAWNVGFVIKNLILGFVAEQMNQDVSPYHAVEQRIKTVTRQSIQRRPIAQAA